MLESDIQQKKLRHHERLVILAGIIVFAVLLLIQTAILLSVSSMYVGKTNRTMINQVSSILVTNNQDEAELVASLKEDYIVRAEAIRYMLAHNVQAEQDIQELTKIANLMNVDEIHLFNEKGVIVGGTTPQYYDFSFDSGEQMAYFKPMLEDKSLTMCQDVTPNTAEGKNMMYAIVWKNDGTGMVQIGIEPKRLLAELKNNEINKVIAKIPTDNGMEIIVADEKTEEILGSTKEQAVGKQLSEYGIDIHSPGLTYNTVNMLKVNSERVYCSVGISEGYIICITNSALNQNSNLIISELIVFFYLLFSFTFILFVIIRMNRKVREEKDLHLKEKEEQNKKLEEAVARANAANIAKTNFLSRMSHDIRTPLNGIIGLIDINEKHPHDFELVSRNRKREKIAADHLLSLINDILQMSKLEDGSVTLAHEAVDLKEQIATITTLVEMRAAEYGIETKFEDCSEELKFPYVYTSPLHLRQIMLNIFINAIKYNKIGGRVTAGIKCKEIKDGIVIYSVKISDTGIGMSEKFLPHLFDPFSQEHTDARSVYNGTGLGMPIVKRLVDAMNGTIDVTSVENQGSTFVITIPFEIADKNDVKKPENVSEDADIKGYRLLVAEDNELNAEIAQTVLEEAGAEVVIVSDGMQAVKKFSDNPPGTYDVILLDIMMPVMDGLTAAKTIRELDREDAKTIPIVAMTANAFDEDVKQCLEAGMNAHLSKPLDMEKVKMTIRQYC